MHEFVSPLMSMMHLLDWAPRYFIPHLLWKSLFQSCFGEHGERQQLFLLWGRAQKSDHFNIVKLAVFWRYPSERLAYLVGCECFHCIWNTSLFKLGSTFLEVQRVYLMWGNTFRLYYICLSYHPQKGHQCDIEHQWYTADWRSYTVGRVLYSIYL